MMTDEVAGSCSAHLRRADAAAEEAACARERAAMIETIRAHAQRDTAALPQGISDDVLKVMAEIERHRFIPDGTCAVGYVDRPVSIGHRSTISQPFIVALMTHLAEVAPDHTVARDRHRLGLPGRDPGAAGEAGLHRRARRAAGGRRHEGARRSRPRQRAGAGRRRLPGLAGMRAVRLDHRHGRDRAYSVAADRAAQGRRQAGDAARATRQGAVPHRGREDRAPARPRAAS